MFYSTGSVVEFLEQFPDAVESRLELSAFDDEELTGIAIGVEELRRRLDSWSVQVLGELEDRSTTDTHHGIRTGPWLAREAMLPVGPAKARVKTASKLRSHLDVVLDALIEGRIAWDHTKVLADAANPRIITQWAEIAGEIIETRANEIFHRLRKDAELSCMDLTVPPRPTLPALALIELRREATATTVGSPSRASPNSQQPNITANPTRRQPRLGHRRAPLNGSNLDSAISWGQPPCSAATDPLITTKPNTAMNTETTIASPPATDAEAFMTARGNTSATAQWISTRATRPRWGLITPTPTTTDKTGTQTIIPTTAIVDSAAPRPAEPATADPTTPTASAIDSIRATRPGLTRSTPCRLAPRRPAPGRFGTVLASSHRHTATGTRTIAATSGGSVSGTADQMPAKDTNASARYSRPMGTGSDRCRPRGDDGETRAAHKHRPTRAADATNHPRANSAEVPPQYLAATDAASMAIAISRLPDRGNPARRGDPAPRCAAEFSRPVHPIETATTPTTTITPRHSPSAARSRCQRSITTETVNHRGT